jgi:transcriptional repressor NrdR
MRLQPVSKCAFRNSRTIAQLIYLAELLLSAVHCPSCSCVDTKVIDSRESEEGAAIRRRRSCTDCGFRFTTYERLENQPLFVIKRDGSRQPFDRAKVASGIQAAVKGRPVEDIGIMAMVERIEDKLRLVGGDVTTSDVGHSVLDELRAADEVAYMRFASVYKNFDDAADFRRELALLQKRSTRA